MNNHKPILLATNNPAKIQFLRYYCDLVERPLLTTADTGVSIDVEETGATFKENAALKAQEYSRYGDYMALASDVGADIPALEEWDPVKINRQLGGSHASGYEKAHTILTLMEGKTDEDRFNAEAREKLIEYISAL